MGSEDKSACLVTGCENEGRPRMVIAPPYTTSVPVNICDEHFDTLRNEDPLRRRISMSIRFEDLDNEKVIKETE